MKVSICMAHWNRLPLLLNTLKTIEAGTRPHEVIIVDDASPEPLKLSDFAELSVPVKFYNIPKEEKNWVNSCVPYNIAFRYVTGDAIIIQNPECMHDGDIVRHVKKHLTKRNYLSYACYSLPPSGSRKIINRIPPKLGTAGWYNHSIHDPRYYHFCSAITTENLMELGGFDYRYAQDRGFDDDELVARIRRMGLRMELIDKPRVFHQYHYSSNPWGHASMRRNYHIYQNYTLKETDWKANITS